VEDQGSYYTLGGMRVKLLFQAEKNTLLGAPLDIIWEAKVNTPEASISGNFYKEEDPDAQVFPNRLSNGLGLSPSAYLYQVYFEPATWDTGQDIEITARVRYESLPGYKHYKFSLKTRELYPVTASKPNIYDSENPQAPIQGADVAMLESVLWQLGLSPQYQLLKTAGNSGSGGARISSHRGFTKANVDKGNVKKCGSTEDANDRSVYYVGWKGLCENNQVSLEGMVRRFQGRMFESTNNSGTTTTAKVHGVVDNTTLYALDKIYQHYRTAIYEQTDTSRFTASNIPDVENTSWWKSLTTLMNSGGVIPYDGSSSNEALIQSYTEDIHLKMKANFPDSANKISRKSILRSWNLKENAGEFWGTGSYQRTPFRIFEGSADEKGSFGFNHIIWDRMYGSDPDCSSLRGYITSAKSKMTHNINLFSPKNSLLAFLAASADNCGSSNGLYRAYTEIVKTLSYKTDIEEFERPEAYCFIDTAVGNSCARIVENKNRWINYDATEVSGQELLGKAIIAYNRGANNFGDEHYFDDEIMLKSDPNIKKTGQKFDYWMQIKKITQTKSGIEGYIPYVTYLWKGGLGFDANGSGGALENILNDPLTLDVDETYNENLIPWCLLYGEKDWMNPAFEVEVIEFDKNGNEVKLIKKAWFDRYRSRAELDDSYKVSCI
jgi:hypothetical protein